MGAPNDDRTTYRDHGAIAVLDLVVEGRPLRFARVPVEVTGADGAVRAYTGGLEIGAIDDSIGADNRTLGVTIRVPGLFWSTLVSRGVVLEGSPATLSLYSPGGDQPPTEVVRGRLTMCFWASPDDVNALQATLDATPFRGGEQVPDTDSAVSWLTWPVDTSYTVDPAVLGAYPPRVYGAPGRDPLPTSIGAGPGSPALLVEYASSVPLAPDCKLAIADGDISEGGTVTATVTDGTLNLSDTGVLVRTTRDLTGRLVSYVRGGDFSGTFGGLYPGRSYYVGLENAASVGLGTMLLDLLVSSGLRVDRGRCEEQRAFLDVYAVDCYIDAPCDPIAWIQSNVVGLFPVSLALGPGGWYFYAIRQDVSDRDVVATFDADGGRVVRASGVQTTGWDAIVNRFTLRFSYRIDNDQPRALVYVDERTVAPSFGLATHLGTTSARASVAQPWGPRSRTVDTRLVGTAAVARKLAVDFVDRFAFPSASVVYTSGAENVGIYPGAYVRVIDTQAGYGAGRIMRVSARSPIPTGNAHGVRVAHTLQTLAEWRAPRSTT